MDVTNLYLVARDLLSNVMGCGSSVTKRSSSEPRQRPEYVRKMSVLDINAPYIPIMVGNNVCFPPSGTTPIIFIFGELCETFLS